MVIKLLWLLVLKICFEKLATMISATQNIDPTLIRAIILIVIGSVKTCMFLKKLWPYIKVFKFACQIAVIVMKG